MILSLVEFSSIATQSSQPETNELPPVPEYDSAVYPP